MEASGLRSRLQREVQEAWKPLAAARIGWQAERRVALDFGVPVAISSARWQRCRSRQRQDADGAGTRSGADGRRCVMDRFSE